MEFLQQLDASLFTFFNQSIANGLFDVVMPFVTDIKQFYPVYILVLLFIFWKGGSKGRWCVLLMLVAAAIADPVSSRLIKESVGRERPCRTLEEVRLLVHCGGGKSFPSTHAVNNFAGFIVFAWFFRRYAWAWLLLASTVSFSRIYVGVHYPFDVIGGALIGMAIGAIVILLFEMVRRRLKGDKDGDAISEENKNR